MTGERDDRSEVRRLVHCLEAKNTLRSDIEFGWALPSVGPPLTLTHCQSPPPLKATDYSHAPKCPLATGDLGTHLIGSVTLQSRCVVYIKNPYFRLPPSPAREFGARENSVRNSESCRQMAANRSDWPYPVAPRSQLMAGTTLALPTPTPCASRHQRSM